MSALHPLCRRLSLPSNLRSSRTLSISYNEANQWIVLSFPSLSSWTSSASPAASVLLHLELSFASTFAENLNGFYRNEYMGAIARIGRIAVSG